MIRYDSFLFDKYSKYSIRYELILYDYGSVKCSKTVWRYDKVGFSERFQVHRGKVGLKNKCSQTTKPQLFSIVCCKPFLLSCCIRFMSDFKVARISNKAHFIRFFV